MLYKTRLLALLVIAVLVSGCSSDKPQMLRVSLDYPGASPQTVVDALAYPIEVQLVGVPGVASITSVSSAGRLEVYVVFTRGGYPRDVLRRIIKELDSMLYLPSLATPPTVEILPAKMTIPDIHPIQRDYVVVELDRDAIASLAISIQDVVSAVHEQAPGSSLNMSRLEKLHAIRISGYEGSVVPLTDVAEIRIEKQPSHIVTKLP